MPNARTFPWFKSYTDALCLEFPIRQKKLCNFVEPPP